MRRLFATITVASALCTMAACGSSSGGGGGTPASSAARKVTVGVIPIVDVAPIYLGKQKGFFSKRGIDLTLVQESGGAAAVPGVVSGQFQFAFGNVVSLLLAESKGLDIKAIANGNASTGVQGKDFGGVVVPKGSAITSAKDLAGKTVAVNNLRNIGDTTVRQSIRKAGGDPATVKFVELNFPDMPAALAQHRVDAAWVVEPFLTVSEQQGATLIASNFVDTAPNLTIATYFTTERQIKADPQLAKNFQAAINESLNYAQSNPAEVRKIILTYTKITPAVADKIILPAWPQSINVQSLDTLAGLMTQDGLVSKKPDVTALIDTSLK